MMRIWGLDLLRCVHCKHFPLELHIIEYQKQELKEKEEIEKPFCKTYCGYLKENIIAGKKYPCEECLTIGIEVGILKCPSCGRWYPIKDGIVYMLTDEKRNKQKDIEFLKKYREKIPLEILERGLPHNLSSDGSQA